MTALTDAASRFKSALVVRLVSATHDHSLFDIFWGVCSAVQICASPFPNLSVDPRHLSPQSPVAYVQTTSSLYLLIGVAGASSDLLDREGVRRGVG